MNKLIIKTKNGKTYGATLPMHFMVAEKYNIEFDDIIDVGFETRGRVVWCNRKPH